MTKKFQRHSKRHTTNQPKKTTRFSHGSTTRQVVPNLIPKSFSAKIDWRHPDELVVNPRNARTHSKKQIQQIATSIREFGFTNPVLVDSEGSILAGHGRVEAAKTIGLDTVPTIRLDHLKEEQKRAYVLADNRLAELAGWDNTLLALELQYLTEIDLEFDVEITGFETAQIDLLIGESLVEGENEEVWEPDPNTQTPIVSQPGDLWALGPHRLYCGNALDPDAYETLMEEQLAQMVFVDPPYNVPIVGNVCGSGRVQHSDFIMASGEMSEAEFTGYLTRVCTNLANYSQNGAINFVCMDWRHIGELTSAGREVYSELKNLCVWSKDNAGMGSFYRSQHELVFVFKHGVAPHINNFGLGQSGRYRTNIWSYPGVNSFRPGRMDELEMHPTVKPVAMVADAIEDCSKRGGIILDAFSGSGTTIIASERTGRVARAMELDPRYVDVAIRRWEKETDEKALQLASGMTLEALAEERLNGEGSSKFRMMREDQDAK